MENHHRIQISSYAKRLVQEALDLNLSEIKKPEEEIENFKSFIRKMIEVEKRFYGLYLKKISQGEQKAGERALDLMNLFFRTRNNISENGEIFVRKNFIIEFVENK